MRNPRISPGEYYHLFNRGVHKETIFHNSIDFARFLLIVLSFQSPVVIPNVSRLSKSFVQHRVLNKDMLDLEKIAAKRYVELVAFCLMPNHFHLIVKEVHEGGISRYMQRALNSFTKYSNIKYDKSGHVFQGLFKAVHIENNEQLLYLSAYIHRNPRDFSQWKDKEEKYIWSSYQDYIGENRWGSLLLPNIITDQFTDKIDYEEFVRTSTAKEISERVTLLLPE